MSWDEFLEAVKKRKHVETPDETHAKIAAIFDDPTITWKKQTLSEVTARYGNI